MYLDFGFQIPFFFKESKSPVASDNNNVVAMAKDDGDEAGTKSLTVTASKTQEKSQRQHPIAKLQGKEFEYLVRQNRKVKSDVQCICDFELILDQCFLLLSTIEIYLENENKLPIGW